MIEKKLKLLGLDSNHTLSDIRKAYRMLAQKNHPDKFTTIKEKTKQSKTYFTKLLKEFPDSEWAPDSKDKIKKIDDAIKTLF